MRTWTTGVHLARAEEYEPFARDQSMPMFMAQPGCLGVVMTRDGANAGVVTLWADFDGLEAAETSATYRAAVAAIAAADF